MQMGFNHTDEIWKKLQFPTFNILFQNIWKWEYIKCQIDEQIEQESKQK